MNITVELPITVHVWTMLEQYGCLITETQETEQNKRTSFVKEYQEDGKILIKFVKSEDNEADIFTKNTSSIIFQKHQEKLVWDKKEVTEDK